MAKRTKKNVWLLWDEEEGTLVGVYSSKKKRDAAIATLLLDREFKDYIRLGSTLYWYDKQALNP